MKIDRITLLKYTLPLILSGLAEQLLLLTDVFLISFKGDIYLATIGLVDAFLLCSLSYGFALNDTFQIFYSRNNDKSILIKNVYYKSLQIFIKYSILIAIAFSGLAYLMNIIFNNNVYNLFLENIPSIIPLIVLNYISMSMNAFLLGMGKTKVIGLTSIISILSNGLLAYIFLFEININISPLSIILYSSIFAETIGILLMKHAIKKSTSIIIKNESVKHILLVTIRKLSYYPAFSDLSFHLGSFVLFLFCSSYFELTETALLTLILSYWGVLLVPVESFSETALNYFSSLYSTRQTFLYRKLRHNIILISLTMSGIILIVLLLTDYLLYGSNTNKLILIAVVSNIVLFGTFNEIFSTILLVRLKNGLYASSKVIYGSVSISSMILLTFFWKSGVISILLSLLFAQASLYLFLKNKSNKIWESRS